MEATVRVKGCAKLRPLEDSKHIGDLLGISARQAQRLAETGELPARKCGCRWRYNTEAIAKLYGLDD